MTADVTRREPFVTDEVTCCDDCPFSVARLPVFGNASFWCAHSALDDRSLKVKNGDEPPPEWCPLRWGPTLVQLKARP